jgi:hypothetical protein
MNNFIINEEEKSRILSMHTKLIKEQQEKTTITEDPNFTILKNAKKVGCLSNGEIFKDKTKNIYFYRKPSSKEPTKEVDFFADMTYKFVDGSKSGKWKCDGLTTLANTDAQVASQKATVDTDIARELEQYGWKKRADIAVTDTELSQLYQKHPKYDLYKLKVNTAKTGGYTEEQKAFITQWNGKGYVEKLSPEQLASGIYQKVKVQGSEEYFPGGLIMYKPAAGAQDKKTCRDDIKTYYNYWKTKREDITQTDFDQLKSKVQACANQFDGKWGGIFSSVDDYVKTLRGGAGGPLSYGEDAKWRLK